MFEREKWYPAGLCFECHQCGQCRSGPDEGYIWAAAKEVQFIADYLQITVPELQKRFLKRIGTRSSIIEDPVTKDCIFLNKADGQGRCAIYPVRPNQCRTWPFWASNLRSPAAWNSAAMRCGGINRGKLHKPEEIEKVKNQQSWW